MFSINCLEITVPKNTWKENKSLYKNLVTKNDYLLFLKKHRTMAGFKKRFFFNDFYKKEQYGDLEINPNRALPENFFGNNINVQAIVGKNGSGKSTLMDLMYMAINNFSYLFDRGNERPGAGDLLYTKSIYLTLYFSIDNNVHILSCKGDVIKLDELLLEIDKNPNGYENKDERYKGIPDELLPIKLKDFFYTIVSNYSMQSFISSNYVCDAFVHKNEFDGNQCDLESYGCWIDPIFHKNDGYKRSIVLNPYRENGDIKMEREQNLSKDRFIALTVKDKNLDDAYSLENIKYSLSKIKDSDLIKYFMQTFLHKNGKNFVDYLKSAFHPEKDLDDKISSDERLKCMVDFYKFKISDKSPYEKKLCLLYLYRKICKIIQTYTEYHDEYATSTPFYINGVNAGTTINKAKTDELLNTIKNRLTHIELKAQRAIKFLELDDNIIQSLLAIKTFDIEDYLKVFSDYSPDSNLDYIIEHLPPSIFDKEITLKNKKNNSIVNYKQLSSGEHQKHQTISTHLYHLTNLISVQKSNETSTKKTLAYKYVNLVFDEIEICFHPEYQRSMINTLLQMLIARKMNINCTINIFVVTHSPFILSDIPASNVLFLEDGTQNVSKNKKTLTFAQNIGEMMYDSFFMKKTIGDFAETKLKELIKWKQGKNSSMSKKEADDILNTIGDPVIRSLIEEIEKIEVSDD